MYTYSKHFLFRTRFATHILSVIANGNSKLENE